ncbi:hypothetical protein [Streptomyces bacillaris]|uniref:hypothetical protein n=1 Tax=Streptomyces bacillaris TaxID=68179 RepID=UPI0036506A1A
MDAGLAAVIAGATGAGGAALAAFATSLGLLKQAKTQGEQAHKQWLRTHQQEAYGEMLSVLESVNRANRDALATARRELREQVAGITPARGLDVAPSEEIQAQARRLAATTQKVQLLGDNDSGEAAAAGAKAMLALSEHTVFLIKEMNVSREPPASLETWGQLSTEANRAYGKFTSAARTSLRAR